MSWIVSGGIMYGGDSYIYLFTIETIGIPKVFLKIAACSFHKFDGIIDIIHIYIYIRYIYMHLYYTTHIFLYTRHIFGALNYLKEELI